MTASRLALLAPALLLFFCLALIPFFVVIGLSLTNYSPAFADRTATFVGLRNYERAATDPTFWHALRYSALFAAVATTFQLIVSVPAGLALSRRARLAKWLLPPLLLASFVPPVTGTLLFKLLLQPSYGAGSYIVRQVLPGMSPNILADPSRVFWVFVAVDTWQWLPLLILLFFLAGQDVDRDALDACAIDGGGPYDRLRTVIAPAVSSYVVVAAILRGLDTLRVFEPVFLLTGGGPGTTTEVLHLFVWRTGFRLWDTSYAAAVGVLFYLVVLAVLWLGFGSLKRVLRWQ